MAKFSVKIDWVTATYKPLVGTQLSEISTYTDSMIAAKKIFVSLGVEDVKLVAAHVSKHYDFTWREVGTGITLDLSRSASTQGFRVVATGQNLNSYGDAREFVKHLCAHDWKLTRLDIALDVFDLDETVCEIAQMWRDLHSELKPHSSKHDVRRGGEMFTIGSRQSARYLRIYDKAKEQGVDVCWIRCELEVKGDIAARLIDDAAEAPHRILGLALPLLALPNSKLASVLREASADGEMLRVVVPRVRGSKELWITKSVIPCLTKLREESPGEYSHIRNLLMEVLIDVHAVASEKTLAL